MAQGKHHNSGLQEDHNKGDTFSFEVIEELPDATLADLKNKESHYINKFNSFREGYNQTPGGAMDQFQGRYEYGGGRLPVEKYQPTDSYLNEVVSYCPECGLLRPSTPRWVPPGQSLKTAALSGWNGT